MNENQKRTIHYSFKATPEEDAMIQKKRWSWLESRINPRSSGASFWED